MNSPIIYHGDLSTGQSPRLTRNGERVTLEDAFREGMVIQPNDMAMVMTLIVRELQNREENQK